MYLLVIGSVVQGWIFNVRCIFKFYFGKNGIVLGKCPVAHCAARLDRESECLKICAAFADLREKGLNKNR